MDHYRKALHRISLESQNSMSSKEECGRIAREALWGPKQEPQSTAASAVEPPAAHQWQLIADIAEHELHGEYWLALRNGAVTHGEYEWVQGGHPHGFQTQTFGRVRLHDVSHCMRFQPSASGRGGEVMSQSFQVWAESRGQGEDDAATIKASDPQYAAQIWAKWDDARSADYTIAGGTPETAKVRCLATGTVTEWIVFGETVPQYTARLRVRA